MKGAITRLGLETVSTPMMGPPWGLPLLAPSPPSTPSARIGAATCITVLSASSGSVRVLRAPYLPCRCAPRRSSGNGHGARGGAGGVQRTMPRLIGDGHPVVDGGPVHAPDRRVHRHARQRGHAPGERAIGDAALLHVVGGQQRQHTGPCRPAYLPSPGARPASPPARTLRSVRNAASPTIRKKPKKMGSRRMPPGRRGIERGSPCRDGCGWRRTWHPPRAAWRARS